MRRLYFIFIFLILFGCSSNHNYIIPFDIEKNFPDRKNGLTQNDINDWLRKMIIQMKINTEGKKIPIIQVFETNGKSVSLNNMINQKTFIYATDSHCSWGLDILEEDLPNTIEKLKGDSIELFTIALLVRDEMDSNEIKSFNKLIDNVKIKYKHFYIIERKDAKRLNIMNATKLLIDSEQNVISWNIGASLDPNGLYNELKNKLLLTNLQPPQNQR